MLAADTSWMLAPNERPTFQGTTKSAAVVLASLAVLSATLLIGVQPVSAAAGAGWDVTVAPPALENPTHITLTATSPTDPMPSWGILCAGKTYDIRLGANEDAIIDFAGTEPLPYPLWIVGGRNVRVVGLEMDLVTQPGCGIGELFNSGSTHRNIHPRLPGGMAIRLENFGTSFVEGVDIDLRGHEADCFVVRNPPSMNNDQARAQRNIVLQNTSCRGIEGLGASAIGDGVHGDLLQNQGEVVNSVILENVSVRSSMEGIVWHEWDGYAGARNFSIRRFDYAGDDRYDDDDAFEQFGVAFAVWAETWDLQDVYIDDPRGNDYGFMNDQRWGGFRYGSVQQHAGITRGLPADVSFAPEAAVGQGYVSPHGAGASRVPGNARDHQIIRLYQAAFGRTPDAGGLAYWTGRAARGDSLATIAANFREAPEWRERYGSTTTDAQLVDLMYRNVLDRTADDAGRVYWLNRLTSRELTPLRLLMFFSESPENITRTNTLPPPS